ncbi:sigma factor-like helix-turn-helix DNA-binding protein [Streptomyces lavendulae]|uniref:sigma factor-like helix-turn-helix DNA-binding protein n=1 Tax=Streptomyces lavendulae TaxID=1914 RepID=UPI0036D1E38C
MSGLATPGSGFRLTVRELEAVDLAADGLTIGAIAERLGVKAATVQSRLKLARLKTGSLRTSALVHSTYASKLLVRPPAEEPVKLSKDELQVLGYLAEGLTVVEMKARVSWPDHRLRDAYGELMTALGAVSRPAYAIKRAWAMGHLSGEQRTV